MMEIVNFKELDEKEFLKKIEFETISSVNQIISDVKLNGDNAIKKYCKQFDNQDLDSFEITAEEIEQAYQKVDESIIKSFKIAIKNVRTFAKRQLNSLKKLNTKIYGCKLGHRIIPIEKIGCYIPGGNYPLPSTAIMTIVPAKVAKVDKIFAFSPKIKNETIVACNLAGADKIYRIGGVQAIAAMAYGSESIEAVDKIVGPGNKYVTAAKKQVYGQCGIDFLAGPSEVLIIADNTANPTFVAADMLAQSEHDIDARAYLICFSSDFALQVKKEAENILKDLPTKDIAIKSFNKSMCIIVDNLKEAIYLSDKKAPEHLEICFSNAQNHIDSFRNYGSLFIGNYSAEVFGDYCSGTNHTLPTNQVARYSGGLSVLDYIKVQTYQNSSKLNARHLSRTASNIANIEGLIAHKIAADLRS